MSSVENLNVGDYIALTKEAYRAERFLPPSYEVEHLPAIQRQTPKPLKVVAVSAPYVLCELVGKEEGSVSVDSRYQQWTKLDELYVREYCRLQKVEAPGEIKTDQDREADRESSKKLCPICTERMAERRSERCGWVLVCKPCQMEYLPIGRVRA